MPGLDKTGPDGQGPMTGRKMGKCTNFGAASKDKTKSDTQETDDAKEEQGRRRFGWGRGIGRAGGGRGWGRGWGRGRGGGMGNRHRFGSDD